MQLSRSSHIAVRVGKDQLESAVAHYKALLGVIEANRTASQVELSGPNFTLWIEVGDVHCSVLQEFNAADGQAARAMVKASGAEIAGESEDGFYVRDRYGLDFHVFIDRD